MMANRRKPVAFAFWTLRHVMALIGVTVALSFTTLPAAAQNKTRQPKVIQLEEIRIEGRVQKPNAFYILNRSQLGYEVLDLRTTFLREIVRSVQSEPF